MEWDGGDTVGSGASTASFAGELNIDSSFERFLFSLLPALVLILLSPFYVRHYKLEPIRVRHGLVLWTKLILAAGLAIVEFSNFRFLRSELGRQTGGSVLVPSVSFIAALSIAFVMEAEHRRALRSSALTGVYLLITLLYDVARAKSHYFYQSQTLANLALAGVALKLCLLLLLEVSKRGLITDSQIRESASEEAVSGFWSRSFLLWLHSTLFLGFHSILSMDDLGPLDPEFSSQALSARLQLSLRTINPSRFWLAKGFLCTFHADIFLTVIPRLFLMGFTFCQPLFIQRTITYVSQESSSKLACLGLVGQSALIFFGIAASRSIYNHMNARQVIIARGALVPLVIDKTLTQPKSTADSSTTNLVTSDIEGITENFSGLHELWAQSAEICLGLYLLSTVESEAAYAVFYIVVAAVVLALCCGIVFSHYSVIWNDSVERRVLQTTKFLSQLKSIKMIGIEIAIAARLQRLRVSEITAYRAVRLAASFLNFISMSSLAFMPVTAIAKAFFGVSFANALFPAKTYSMLAILALTGFPLSQVLANQIRLRSTMASINRVQKHLISQQKTFDESNAGRSTTTLGSLGLAPEPQAAGRIFEFNDAYLAPSQLAEPVLRNVSCAVNQSQITAIVGPVASGKTTLIRAMLGEATTHDGVVRRKNCRIAYCGQKPWLRNASIRSNIIGPASFDPVRYEVAINASALSHDLHQLPTRDLTIVGSNGTNLSGGQRHRVALARALYSRAQILLLDDIFSGLDTSTAEDIHNRLFGPKGIVRKSNLTVVFTTHSTSFMKVAHQALILNSTGTVTVQPDPSKIALSEDFGAQLAPSSETTASTTRQTSTEERSAMDIPDFESSNNIRQRGDWNLYGYYLSPTSLWKVSLAFLGVLIAVASEYFGDLFVRYWLETGGSNEDYLTAYAWIAVMTILVTFCSLSYSFLVVAPQNSLKIHKNLLDSVTKAKLSHLNGVDISSVLKQFGQDLIILTDFIPKMLYGFLYGATHVFLSTCFILSGMRHSALAMPFLIIVLYTIPAYSLRTSRQMKHLNSEATEPLYKLTNEVESGLEHIRGFGWQSQFATECIEALDHSQRPFYYKLAVQRWVELAMDISTLGLVFVVVFITAATKDTANQTATGLSLLHMASFSLKLHETVSAFVQLETFLACVARMRSFIHSMPVEDGDVPTSLPPRWPTVGNIELSNVTVQYTPTNSTPVLNDVSLTIRGGQKVGISGRSGSGKTSFLLTLLRLTEYTGTIVIDGIDISTIPPQQLRTCITTISQDTVKIDGTVRENLLPYEGQMLDETITEDILLEALDQTELTQIIERRGGLEADISTMGFSEGEMQLLCLARAIVHHTCTQSRLVLLDEPTSNLDIETDNRIQAALRDAFLDCTIVLVSHRAESLWDSNVRFEVKNKRMARFTTTPKPSPKPLPFHTMLRR